MARNRRTVRENVMVRAEWRIAPAALATLAALAGAVACIHRLLFVPPMTPVPISWREMAPAPVEVTSVTVPTMKAIDVRYRDRRNRRAAPSQRMSTDDPGAIPYMDPWSQ
jgi:hypothetical protein